MFSVSVLDMLKDAAGTILADILAMAVADEPAMLALDMV